MAYLRKLKTLKTYWNRLEINQITSTQSGSQYKKIRIYATTMQRAMRPPLIKSGTKKSCL